MQSWKKVWRENLGERGSKSVQMKINFISNQFLSFSDCFDLIKK